MPTGEEQNYPILIPVNYPGNHTNGTIPRRLIFDLADVSINEENYQAAIQRMGADVMTTRVWWDNGNLISYYHFLVVRRFFKDLLYDYRL